MTIKERLDSISDAEQRNNTRWGIADSGVRRTFESGAVRDVEEGKGRCDLLPLDIVAQWTNSEFLRSMADFERYGELSSLYLVWCAMLDELKSNEWNALLEVSKHFEAGAKKYGEYNWQKGIPFTSYTDSAIRHYCKWRRGDTDERHDRACLWNIMCCAWEVLHHEESRD